MPSGEETILSNLCALVVRLESELHRPRGRTNLAGAARYLGLSDEALRQRHLKGKGPKRSRNGRMWSYDYADLDRYAEGDSS
jgi:hypothetical protein